MTNTLPPLPEPARQVVYNESKGYTFDAYTAGQMRAYARAALAQTAASGEPPLFRQYVDQQVAKDMTALYAAFATTQPAGSREPVAEVGDLVIEVRERVMAAGFKNRDPLYTSVNSVLP